MMQTVTERKRNLLVAGVLALISQGAVSGEVAPVSTRMEVVRVTAPRPASESIDAEVEIRAAEIIEAMNARISQDRRKNLDAIRPTRIELAISEVPTRG